VPFQVRINPNTETLNTLIWVVQKGGFGLEEVSRSTADKAVERLKGLGVPDFVRTIETHLPQIVLISANPVPQVRCEARFNIVQQ